MELLTFSVSAARSVLMGPTSRGRRGAINYVETHNVSDTLAFARNGWGSDGGPATAQPQCGSTASLRSARAFRSARWVQLGAVQLHAARMPY